jgi:enolase
MIELDGTPDKHRLGGNAIYSTSIALLRAASAAAGMPTYTYVGALLGLKPPTTVPAELSSPHFARVVLISVETR